MAHAQKPDFVFQRNGRAHLNRRGRQFSRLMAGEVCASAVIMLDTPCSEVVWRVLATHSIRKFPLHSPPARYPVPSHLNWSLPLDTVYIWCWKCVLFKAKRYGFNCAGFEPRYGQESFSPPHQFRPALGPAKPPTKWVPGPFPGGRPAGPWRGHPPPSDVEVQNEWIYTSTPHPACVACYAETFAF